LGVVPAAEYEQYAVALVASAFPSAADRVRTLVVVLECSAALPVLLLEMLALGPRTPS
jgi:hypothetical protein